jgi:hypothetical protein
MIKHCKIDVNRIQAIVIILNIAFSLQTRVLNISWMAMLWELVCNVVSNVFRLTSLRRLCLSLIAAIEQEYTTMIKQAVM